MKAKPHTKYMSEEELAEEERIENERLQKLELKRLNDLKQQAEAPISKPTMATCTNCGKSVNATGLEKHMRLCNYTGKSIKKRKIEKLEEITNKIDSDEKIKQNRILNYSSLDNHCDEKVNIKLNYSD